MANEELLALSAVELRRRIGTKEISPVELLEASLQRIETINPAVNAVTAMCVARARKEAKAAEQAVKRGEALPLLHGLPTGIKDLEETKDLLTTYGSPLYRDFVPSWDNVMVARVRGAGAIVVGKTNVPEFGAGSNSRNPVWGATGNPFNPMLNAGGSSGGSAAALATDMLPVCTGSDTGGSLRNPAAFCGIVGFRPSPGMVAVERRAMGWTPISVLGPMGAPSPTPVSCMPRRSASTIPIRCPSRSMPRPTQSHGRPISAACAWPTRRISAAPRWRRTFAPPSAPRSRR